MIELTECYRLHCSDIGQSRCCGIKEVVCRHIIGRQQPLRLEYSPKRFGNIEFGRIRGKIKNVQSSFFPYRSKFIYLFVTVYGRVVEHNKSFLFNAERKVIHKGDELVCIDGFLRRKSMIPVVPADYSEYVEPSSLLGWNINIHPRKFPSVGNISLCAYMAFIAIVEIYQTIDGQLFKFLQLLDFPFIEVRRGFPLGAKSYSPKSCAKTPKKRLNVHSLASLPVAVCHASLAFFTRIISSSIACFTAAVSVSFIIGLRPWPGLVLRPSMPSARYLFTHLLTDCSDISVTSPTSLDIFPWLFNIMTWHRMRKQCVFPLRNPFCNFCSSSSDIFSLVILIVLYYDLNLRKRFNHNYE